MRKGAYVSWALPYLWHALQAFLFGKLVIFFHQVDCSEEAELCQSFGVSCFENSLFSWELNYSGVVQELNRYRQPTSERKLHLMLG